MDEEIFIGLFWGVLMALPFGWFLRSAAQWRREARQNQVPVVQPVVVSPSTPPAEARLEKVLERLTQRLETVEDRIDFTERLLDARSSGAPLQGRRDPAQR
ncbi:MAG: hypothetical protein ACRENP_09955 [Longimicrobiales bacterium]